MEERVKFVVLAERDQQCFSSLCMDFGISRKTGYKWLARKREKGLDGLVEMSRRPSSNKRSISATIIKLTLSLKKKHPNWGPKKLWVLLHRDCGIKDRPHINTVTNILRRHGLSTRKKRRGKLIRCPQAEQTEASHPNHIWGVDFKGWFNLANAERCDPLTVSDLFSRMILCCKAMRNQQWRPVKKAFVQVFRRYGLPEIIRVDNGVPFGSVRVQGLSKLSIWWSKKRGRTGMFDTLGFPKQSPLPSKTLATAQAVGMPRAGEKEGKGLKSVKPYPLWYPTTG